METFGEQKAFCYNRTPSGQSQTGGVLLPLALSIHVGKLVCVYQDRNAQSVSRPQRIHRQIWEAVFVKIAHSERVSTPDSRFDWNRGLEGSVTVAVKEGRRAADALHGQVELAITAKVGGYNPNASPMPTSVE